MCIYHGNDQTFTEAIDIYENHHIASACIFILLHLYAKFKNIYLSRRIDNTVYYNQSNTQAFVWIKETVCLADVSENSVS